MLSKVVVGVDGSAGAHAALCWIAEHDIGEVHIVHAVSPAIELLEAGIQIDVTNAIHRVGDLLRTKWVEGTGLDPEKKYDHVIEDSTVRALFDTAHRFEADAIVVGASGQEHIDGLVGATIGRLVHVSDLPLIVVPPGWSQSDVAEPRVVVAISGDRDRDRQVVDWARRIADGQQALHLVYAANPGGRSNLARDKLVDSFGAEMSSYMRELLGDSDPNDRVEVRVDDPVSAIAGASNGVVMSVVGTRRLGRLRGFSAARSPNTCPWSADARSP